MAPGTPYRLAKDIKSDVFKRTVFIGVIPVLTLAKHSAREKTLHVVFILQSQVTVLHSAREKTLHVASTLQSQVTGLHKMVKISF
jgi:hypothetical protein